MLTHTHPHTTRGQRRASRQTRGFPRSLSLYARREQCWRHASETIQREKSSRGVRALLPSINDESRDKGRMGTTRAEQQQRGQCCKRKHLPVCGAPDARSEERLQRSGAAHRARVCLVPRGESSERQVSEGCEANSLETPSCTLPSIFSLSPSLLPSSSPVS